MISSVFSDSWTLNEDAAAVKDMATVKTRL